MKFGAVDMMGLLWIVPLVWLLYYISAKATKSVLLKFSDTHLLAEIMKTLSVKMRTFKMCLILLSVLLVIVTFLRPQWGFTWQEVRKQGLDIMIALDTSKSMLAEDVLPNRLDRSKFAIEDLVKKLKSDRIGLIAFSGTAFLQCPLTVDYNGFLLSLKDVSVDTIPVGGTSISNAIYEAVKSFEKGKQNKVLIIITDGEDLEGGVERAIMKAKAMGIKIFCVGIGTESGELIPITTETGGMSYLKDENGNVVKTKLNEDVLEGVALSTDGMYVRSSGAEFGLDLIYEKKLSTMEKDELKSRMEKNYNERFQIPLMLAFLLLLLEPLVSERRRDK